MSTKFASAIAVFKALKPPVAFAQGRAAPTVVKPDLQKLVNSIKADKSKLDQFSDITKLASQAGALAEENPNDAKLKDLGKQMDDIAARFFPRMAANEPGTNQ